MSTWYEKSVFYHMYPLGMTGAPKENRSLTSTLWDAPLSISALFSNPVPTVMIPGIIK